MRSDEDPGDNNVTEVHLNPPKVLVTKSEGYRQLWKVLSSTSAILILEGYIYFNICACVSIYVHVCVLHVCPVHMEAGRGAGVFYN